MFEKLMAKYRAWSAKCDREFERSRTIKFLVEIPYSEANLRLLSKQDGSVRSIGDANLIVKAAVFEKMPFENLGVRCVGNADWRK